jgi:hypothetical protein
VQPTVAADRWLTLFGRPAGDAELATAVAPLDILQRIADHEDPREVDFTDECGLVLYFEKAGQLRVANPTARRGLVLGAVKFFRARDLEARQYLGECRSAWPSTADSPGKRCGICPAAACRCSTARSRTTASVSR